MSAGELLFVHHFSLARITGVTVTLKELLRHLAPRASAYQSYEDIAGGADLIAVLDARHADAACVVGINIHIEVQWELTLALAEWCRRRAIPAVAYVFDYWPHHRENLRLLVHDHGMRVLASTPFIRDALADDGFPATLVQVGVPIPDAGERDDDPAPDVVPKLIGSAGRLVPRKRFSDLARAFCEADIAANARLYLRLLPSLVFGAHSDAEQLRLIEAEIARGGAEKSIEIDRTAAEFHDYARYAIYVCPSGYEGFSMGPIEAALHQRPPIISDIAPHRTIAETLFGAQASEFLFPVGDTRALAELLRDEVVSGRRSAFLTAHRAQLRRIIEAKWSLRSTARALTGHLDGSDMRSRSASAFD
jgi:glycosyltransferase involved in cell wall biosynthesis